MVSRDVLRCVVMCRDRLRCSVLCHGRSFLCCDVIQFLASCFVFCRSMTWSVIAC